MSKGISEIVILDSDVVPEGFRKLSKERPCFGVREVSEAQDARIVEVKILEDGEPLRNGFEIVEGTIEGARICVRKSRDLLEISSRSLLDLRISNENSSEEAMQIPGSSYYLICHFDAPENHFECKEKEEKNDKWMIDDDMHSMEKLDPTNIQGDVGESSGTTAASKSEELGQEEEKNQENRIEDLIENARLEKERLAEANYELERKIAAKLERSKNAENSIIFQGGGRRRVKQSAADREQKFRNALSAYGEARETLQRTRESYDTVAMQLQAKLDGNESKRDEIRRTFNHFKKEIAKQAENSRSGKKIPEHIIEQFEESEANKTEELEKIRLRNLHLRSELSKLEKALQNKERLADGLHLIDFEQLKIENQALSEKIEDRNEDLMKLNKKTTTTVQVLTHLKEKLVFVQAEAVSLQKDLSLLDSELQTCRDQLSQNKRQRDNLRDTNTRLRESQGFHKSKMLVQDFHARAEEIKALQLQVKDLMQKHANLSSTTSCEQESRVEK